jgi:hypothetical protein
MARRGGRKGAWLASDDYTGFTVEAHKLKLDYWGNRTVKPLLRNLQEVATPLNDPLPVPFYNPGDYESVTPCQFETQPIFIGLTNIRTPYSPVAQSLGLSPGISDATVGCTFVVY